MKEYFLVWVYHKEFDNDKTYNNGCKNHFIHRLSLTYFEKKVNVRKAHSLCYENKQNFYRLEKTKNLFKEKIRSQAYNPHKYTSNSLLYLLLWFYLLFSYFLPPFFIREWAKFKLIDNAQLFNWKEKFTLFMLLLNSRDEEQKNPIS